MGNKYSYKFTLLAEEDINSVLEYITADLCNEKAASDLFFEIEKAIDIICEFPYSSASCEIFLISDKNIRHILVKNYCMIYEIKEDKKQINVLRFRFSKMNLTKLDLK